MSAHELFHLIPDSGPGSLQLNWETSSLVKHSSSVYPALKDTMGGKSCHDMCHEDNEDVAIRTFSPCVLVNLWLSPAKPQLDRRNSFSFSKRWACLISM